MDIDGGCHCGAISYRARINPENVVICHCNDCQTISGAPYRVNVPVLSERFELTGVPTTYVKTGGSGEAVNTTFCGRCGTALYSSKGEAPVFVFLRLGSVRQRADLPPKAQGFCASAMPWAVDLSEVRRIPEPERG
jgi:hypothetical protein